MKTTLTNLSKTIESLKNFRVGEIYNHQIETIAHKMNFVEKNSNYLFEQNKKMFFQYLKIKKEVLSNLKKSCKLAKHQNKKLCKKKDLDYTEKVFYDLNLKLIKKCEIFFKIC